MNRMAAAAGAVLLALFVLVGIVYALSPGESAPEAGEPARDAPPPSRSQEEGAIVPAGAPVAPAAVAVEPTVAPEGTVDWKALDAKIEHVRLPAWTTMKPQGWRDLREELLTDLGAVRALPEAERAAHREDELRLLAQIGRAAENANDPIAPFYAPVNGVEFNTAWYEAAALVVAGDRALLDVLGDNEREAVERYVKQIDQGTAPKVPPRPLAR